MQNIFGKKIHKRSTYILIEQATIWVGLEQDQNRPSKNQDPNKPTVK